jgi:methionyl-tRNA formyltransferase
VRAFNPWPAASTSWQGQQLKVLQAVALPGPVSGEPGRVHQIDGALAASTGDGLLRLDEVQLAGRAAMSAVQFARGQRSFVGSILG